MTPLRRSTVLLALGAVSLAVAAPADGQSSAPTSADQCKDGGWKTFTAPAFANQGACITYVKTLGTPAAGNPGAGNGTGQAGAPESPGKSDAAPGQGQGQGHGQGQGEAPGLTAPAAAPSTPAAETVAGTPKLGRSSVAQVESGTVTVKLPGAASFAPVTDGVVPLGATVDATEGKIRVVTALPGGKTQAATFWGGAFTLGQSDTDGRVDIALPEVSRDACAKPGVTAFSAASRKRGKPKAKSSLRSLWVEDRNGKFRTTGSKSVASVRGTTWVTRERCEGTFTYVREGRVDVRNRETGKVTVVTAGHGVLAR